MVRPMRIGIVGLGMGGATLACLLADRGVDVTVLEQAEDPRPVGAGIWLQAMGQAVLDRIDLLEPLAAVSRPVSRVRIETSTGRELLDFGYDAVPGAAPALGVHRGALFGLLHEAVLARGVPVHLGVPVSGVRPTTAGVTVETPSGDHSSYDLVVGCDGSRSSVRRSMNVTVRDREYEYGALWAIVDDPEALAADCLFQSLRGTREYLGVLPTGQDRSSVFWSVRRRDMHAVVTRGLPAWREGARPLAGRFAPLLDGVEELLPAGYRDVATRTPYRVDGARGAVLVGDAAHAMSPQLGTGTSLALADAWALDHALAGQADVPRALAAYAAGRAGHVRWYQWLTRLMMPVFQSDLTPLAWPRDLLAPAVMRVPGMTGQMVATLLGDRTSPWSAWALPTHEGSAR